MNPPHAAPRPHPQNPLYMWSACRITPCAGSAACGRRDDGATLAAPRPTFQEPDPASRERCGSRGYPQGRRCAGRATARELGGPERRAPGPAGRGTSRSASQKQRRRKAPGAPARSRLDGAWAPGGKVPSPLGQPRAPRFRGAPGAGSPQTLAARAPETLRLRSRAARLRPPGAAAALPQRSTQPPKESHCRPSKASSFLARSGPELPSG